MTEYQYNKKINDLTGNFIEEIYDLLSGRYTETGLENDVFISTNSDTGDRIVLNITFLKK